ncbi:MAG: hypothetical protein RSC49_01010 [Clostridium sp.]
MKAKIVKRVMFGLLVILTIASHILFFVLQSKSEVNVTGVITDKFGEAVSKRKSHKVYTEYTFIIRIDNGKYIDTRVTPVSFSLFNKGDRINVDVNRSKIDKTYDFKMKIVILTTIILLMMLLPICIYNYNGSNSVGHRK